jgi:hypothetical protein
MSSVTPKGSANSLKKSLATPQFFFHGDGAGGFPILGTGGIEVLRRSPSPLSAKGGLRVINL